MLFHMDLSEHRDDPLIANASNPKKLALCLSGGGYRAMLYHVGALWRLNEWGFLLKLGLISSVSGGSITAGVLGLNWGNLVFDGNSCAVNFEEKVVAPILMTADRTIDIPCTLLGIFDAGGAGHRVATYHEKHLFGSATLQDLPDESTSPRFIFNASNLQTAVNWRFCRAFMGDYRVGLIHNPSVKLSVAVAASGAFPPFLSPLRLKLSSNQYVKDDKTVV